MRTVLTPEQKETILREYDNGKGKFINQLTRELGIKYPQVIANFLRKSGVVITDRRPGPVGPQNPKWKGGRKFSKCYFYLLLPDHPNCNPDGYVLEHRVVMEKFLGRYLDRKEVVHHKNGLKTDNRIENLELHKSNGDHLSEHSKTWKRNEFGGWGDAEKFKGRCIMLERDGQIHHVAEWARIIGVSKACILNRLKIGLTGEDLFAPPKPTHGRSLTYSGKTMLISEWAKFLGMSVSRIKNRLHKGFPLDLVLSDKPLPRGNSSYGNKKHAKT